MAGQSYFIWQGVDCRAMGIRLSGPVAIVWPEERVEHIQIPGMSGDLTSLEGEEVYNSYIQTANIQVFGWNRCRMAKRWLRGSGYVTFSGEPDRKQAARVIGAVTLNRHSKNLDVWEGEVQFYCQPLKEKVLTTSPVLTSAGSVRNYGDVTCYPIWRVTASGTTVVLNDGATTGEGYSRIEAITLTGVTSGHVYRIDSEAQEVYDQTVEQMVTVKSSGTFPTMLPGNNYIGGSGWSRVEIDRRERYL